ncbi:MAG: hypothetical protein KGO49_08325 [Gammaproteobacteria bacterium]|nr:hypothetical protein [Gammaproteobacteria bacterium]
MLHTKQVYWALDTLFERSIEQRTKDIVAPLDNRQMRLSGGQDYSGM